MSESIILGTQYFRPPFPRQRYWQDDFRQMADAGLNTVQFWLVWGWVEPEPGRYVFDDYDRLCDLAATHGLQVVLSTLPEVNPFWLPRVHPDAHMVDINGQAVTSCNRGECISGLVPGSCFRHPAVNERMSAFLTRCGEHFTDHGALLAWDAWNENRWRNFAPDAVCFCEHCLAAMRDFLREKHGSLEALGQTWGRRLTDWRDVRIGRLLGNSYPEWTDYTDWMCHQAVEMIDWRIASIRAGDPRHPISSHTGSPTIYGGVNLDENVFSRGIDWDIARGETYGFSSFPVTGLPGRGEMSPEEFCTRCSSMTTTGKPIWMSELQGGPTAHSRWFGRPISGAEQQAWIWTGISRGIQAVIFWCWRPEVFGNECNGFGFLGLDGLANDRMAAMQETSRICREHADLLRHYQPATAEVAVVFQRGSYLYDWLAHSHTGEDYAAPDRFLAWPYALERANLPYAIHDDRHLPDVHDYRLVIVPDAAGLDDAAVVWLLAAEEAGATVFVEGNAGAFGADSFWRYPSDRPLYTEGGLDPRRERRAPSATWTLPVGGLGNESPLPLSIGRNVMTFGDDDSLLARRGGLIALGSTVSEPDALLALLSAEAGLAPGLHVGSPHFCTARIGRSGDARLLIVVNHGHAQTVRVTLAEGGNFHELRGRDLPASGSELDLELAAYDHAIVVIS